MLLRPENQVLNARYVLKNVKLSGGNQIVTKNKLTKNDNWINKQSKVPIWWILDL